MDLVTKIYFPREILPFSSVIAAFFDFLVASTVFIGLIFFYKVQLSIQILWFPLLLSIQVAPVNDRQPLRVYKHPAIIGLFTLKREAGDIHRQAPFQSSIAKLVVDPEQQCPKIFNWFMIQKDNTLLDHIAAWCAAIRANMD